MSSPSPDLPNFHFAQPPWQRAESVDSEYSGGGNESSMDHLHTSGGDYDGVDIDDDDDDNDDRPVPVVLAAVVPKQSPQLSIVRRGSQDSVTGALRVTRPPPATPRIVHQSLPPFGYTPALGGSVKHERPVEAMCVDPLDRKKRRLGSGIESSRFRTDFTNVELIGKGSFADVFKVRHKVDNQWYAIKRLKKHCTNQANKDACEREARALALVSAFADQAPHLSVHIIRYFSSWFEDTNRLFIQMEYCVSTLSELMPIDVPTIFRLIQNIASGLLFLHDRLNLVHLDVKPANILVTNSGLFKLGDLGLVCSSVAGELTELTSGDARYLPREILLNNFAHLPKADVFSLGATILECMLKERLPAEGPEWHNLRDGILPINEPTELFSLVTQMLVPDPAQRPAISQVLDILSNMTLDAGMSDLSPKELTHTAAKSSPGKSIILSLQHTRQKLKKLFTAN